MSDPSTITINGVKYDAHSGQPLQKQTNVTLSAARPVTHAKSIHHKTQRSATLSRQFVKKTTAPEAKKPVSHNVKRPTVERSPHISRFARDPQAAPARTRTISDFGPAKHPVVEKAHKVQTARTAHHAQPHHQPRPAQEIKETAIATALAQAKPAKHEKKQSRSKRRWVNVTTASAALILIAGYFTYVNMPNISVRVAAAQAGINATYPEYQPAGYQLHGPVAYSEGQVSMEFAANSGPQNFTLNQTKSSWDSSALLAKYVDPKSEGNYATYSDAGLTIYTYGNHAAWVNGGILYTIDGSATLSNDQVRHIATSM